MFHRWAFRCNRRGMKGIQETKEGIFFFLGCLLTFDRARGLSEWKPAHHHHTETCADKYLKHTHTHTDCGKMKQEGNCKCSCYFWTGGSTVNALMYLKLNNCFRAMRSHVLLAQDNECVNRQKFNECRAFVCLWGFYFKWGHDDIKRKRLSCCDFPQLWCYYSAQAWERSRSLVAVQAIESFSS